ncbi:MAG: hypothetical protein EXR84_05625 [Gammaproteobacteria bacterium]|nr:hypothetical protein [Gammaproteobacteria bacterium]
MNTIKSLVLRNRYTLLVTVLAVYVLVLVLEGAITGREVRVIDFDNPFFDLIVRNFEEFMDDSRQNRDADQL